MERGEESLQLATSVQPVIGHPLRTPWRLDSGLHLEIRLTLVRIVRRRSINVPRDNTHPETMSTTGQKQMGGDKTIT